jgi:hypothetical protein
MSVKMSLVIFWKTLMDWIDKLEDNITHKEYMNDIDANSVKTLHDLLLYVCVLNKILFLIT